MPGSRPTTGGGPGPQVRIVDLEQHYQGPVRYRLTLDIGSLRLHRVLILQQGSEWWTFFPTRPTLDSKGKAMRRNSGGYISHPIVEIPDARSKRRFDAAVMTALREHIEREVS